ncbi:MAG TPA: Flp family type IVb pilin [Caulobacteraceae bacterium]|nr:Flp family type IVb pilin [Caulobacteraceae bacterium]
MRPDLKAFAHDQSGATAIEYGLIVSLIFLVCVSAIGMFSSNAVTMYNTVSTTIAGAMR